jgi:hypothetical protein
VLSVGFLVTRGKVCESRHLFNCTTATTVEPCQFPVQRAWKMLSPTGLNRKVLASPDDISDEAVD